VADRGGPRYVPTSQSFHILSFVRFFPCILLFSSLPSSTRSCNLHFPSHVSIYLHSVPYFLFFLRHVRTDHFTGIPI
jgi:hypothetical protein